MNRKKILTLELYVNTDKQIEEIAKNIAVPAIMKNIKEHITNAKKHAEKQPLRDEVLDLRKYYKPALQRIFEDVPAYHDASQILDQIGVSNTDLTYKAYDQLDRATEKLLMREAKKLDATIVNITVQNECLRYRIVAKEHGDMGKISKLVDYLKENGLDAKYNGYNIVISNDIPNSDLSIVLMYDEDREHFSLLIKVGGDEVDFDGDAVSPFYLDMPEEINFVMKALKAVKPLIETNRN